MHLEYTLSRRQRLAVELLPWLPAVAAALGFAVGAAFLSLNVSRWFLVMLLLPPVVYRGLFAFAFDIVFRGGRHVVVTESDGELEVRSRGETKYLPLDGVFQVFRTGAVWTVLHLDGTTLTIPVSAITGEQVDYLKSFARRARRGLRPSRRANACECLRAGLPSRRPAYLFPPLPQVPHGPPILAPNVPQTVRARRGRLLRRAERPFGPAHATRSSASR